MIKFTYPKVDPLVNFQNKKQEYKSNADNRQLFDSNATKIQNFYKTYKHVLATKQSIRSEKVDGITLKIRGKVLEHMKKITKFFDSSSANISNNAANDQNLDLAAQVRTLLDAPDINTLGENPSFLIEYMINNRHANCGDQALILFILLHLDESLDKEFKNNIKMVALNEPHEHVFLMYGDLVIDPWIGHVDFVADSNRKYHVKAKSIPKYGDKQYPEAFLLYRTRGFLGNQKEFLELLGNMRDDIYLYKNKPIEIVTEEITTSYQIHADCALNNLEQLARIMERLIGS